MNTFLSGVDIVRTIPLTVNGSQVYPTALSYRLLDGSETEIIGTTNIGFDSDDLEVSVTVLAVNNTLPAEKVRDIRMIELRVTTVNGVHIIKDRYLIESGDGLVTWENTFMTYSDAILEAFDVPATEAWDTASEQDRIVALKEAYFAIAKMKFLVSDYWSEPFMLSELTDEDIASLPVEFTSALKKAQIAESDVILGGEYIEDRRRDGLMSETVGESSNMFRPGKPIMMPIRSRAQRYLASYIYLKKRLARS